MAEKLPCRKTRDGFFHAAGHHVVPLTSVNVMTVTPVNPSLAEVLFSSWSAQQILHLSHLDNWDLIRVLGCSCLIFDRVTDSLGLLPESSRSVCAVCSSLLI